MKHFGDICKLNGAELPPVDVIIGGSPCQDLSIAGNRSGLSGERSGLFMEQIRIIKEMRERGRTDDNIRLCRYAVWENVPGAMSSGTPKGEDFRIVLEEFCKIFDPDAVVPCPVCGKEAKADVMATFLPEQYRETDDGGGAFVDVVFLRYRVKKHMGCKFNCHIGKTYCIDPNRQYLKDAKLLMWELIDDFQGKMEKGEIEWNK